MDKWVQIKSLPRQSLRQKKIDDTCKIPDILIVACMSIFFNYFDFHNLNTTHYT